MAGRTSTNGKEKRFLQSVGFEFELLGLRNFLGSAGII